MFPGIVRSVKNAYVILDIRRLLRKDVMRGANVRAL